MMMEVIQKRASVSIQFYIRNICFHLRLPDTNILLCASVPHPARARAKTQFLKFILCPSWNNWNEAGWLGIRFCLFCFESEYWLGILLLRMEKWSSVRKVFKRGYDSAGSVQKTLQTVCSVLRFRITLNSIIRKGLSDLKLGLTGSWMTLRLCVISHQKCIVISIILRSSRLFYVPNWKFHVRKVF